MLTNKSTPAYIIEGSTCIGETAVGQDTKSMLGATAPIAEGL